MWGKSVPRARAGCVARVMSPLPKFGLAILSKCANEGRERSRKKIPEMIQNCQDKLLGHKTRVVFERHPPASC